jgi:hypothetical protein
MYTAKKSSPTRIPAYPRWEHRWIQSIKIELISRFIGRIELLNADLNSMLEEQKLFILFFFLIHF